MAVQKLIRLGVAAAMFAGSAQALELGPVTLLSHLNEPLLARIDLGEVAQTELADLHFALADQKTYQNLGLSKPFYLNDLRFRLISSGNQQHAVELRTRQRLREPIIEILLSVEGMQGSLTRLYSLMLDPPLLRPATHPTTLSRLAVATAQPDRESIGEQPEKRLEKEQTSTIQTSANKVTPLQGNQPVAKTGAVSAAKMTKLPAYQPGKRLQVGRDSISIIAQNSKLHEKYSVYQIMRAFYLLNPDAFIAGNINHLQSGSELMIPDQALVAEVPRQQAVNFVLSVSRDHPEISHPLRRSSFSQSPTIIQKTAETDTKTSSVQKKTDVVDRKVATPAEGPETPMQSSAAPAVDATSVQRMQQDVKSWRSMADEFSGLTALTQSQNRVLQTHGKVLNALDQQMQQQMERISRLEQQNTGAASDANVQPTADSVDAGANAAAVGGSLERLEQTIQNLNQRLQLLEERSVPLATPANPKEVADRIPANEESSWWNSALPLYLLLAVTMLLLLWREASWRRRAASVQQASKDHSQADRAQTDTETNDTRSVEPALQTPTEHGEEVRQEPKLDSQMNIGQTLVASNLQAAEAEKQTELTELPTTEATVDLSANPDHSLPSGEAVEHKPSGEDDIQATVAEIDILLAYQLYEEAEQHIARLKQSGVESAQLEVREMEVMARLGQNDLFMMRYEEMATTLSQACPQCWKKIEALRAEMIKGYPRAVEL